MLEPEAIADLFVKYKPLFRHIAMRVVWNESDAEDAVAMGMLRALECCERFRKDSSPLTWISVVVLNAARTVRRDIWGQRRRPIEAAYGKTEPAGFDEEVETREVLQALMQAVSPACRAAVRQTLAEGILRDLADELEQAPCTPRVHLFRARNQMRAEWRRIEEVKQCRVAAAAAGRAA